MQLMYIPNKISLAKIQEEVSAFPIQAFLQDTLRATLTELKSINCNFPLYFRRMKQIYTQPVEKKKIPHS
jgi:hypothetical protein